MNKQKQLSKNSRKKYRRYMRRFNNNISNSSQYQFSSKTQTLGVGKTSVRVTRYYTIEQPEGYANFTLNVLYDSVTSPEFNRMATDYTYCKLKLVTVTISPRNIQTDTMNFFKMQWNISGVTDVRYDDNAKLIYTNLTYPKQYRFKPPNVMEIMSDNSYINYNEWIQCVRVNNVLIPGTLKVTSAISFTFQVEVKWVFRGLNSIAPTEQKIIKVKPENTHNDDIDDAIFELKKIAHKIDKIEEEQEEEEEKEQENKVKNKKKNKNK